MKTVRILCVGIGGYANVGIGALLEHYGEGYEIAGLVDPFPDGCRYLDALKAKGIPLYGSMEDFYREKSADLAILTTPIHLHTRGILLALSHGTNVLCEKPLSGDPDDAAQINAAAEKAGRFVMIGYQWSYSRAINALKEDVLAGLYGAPVLLKTMVLWPRDFAYFTRGTGWAGKDFFVDKAPLITLDQLALVKEVLEETKRKYIVYYGESIDNPATIFARDLVARGVIGDIFHIEGTAPHRLNPESRPDWFWRKEDTGGLLIDLGSHQMHQFLDFAGCEAAKVESARAQNHFNAAHPEFEDFADVTLTADNGVTGYFRLDWCSPKGLSSWGDVRLVIEGERGSIELRKNLNVGTDENANHVFVVTEDGEYHASVTELAKSRFFENLLYDLEHRTEYAIKQSTALAAIELAILAQKNANLNGED